MTLGTWSLLVLLVGSVGGQQPLGGYCIGNGCFAWFRVPSDFSTAQGHCRDRGGDLVTVRTSVSNDVLSVLLGNVSGSFWIGLHRPSGCPDPAARLGGFRWVTGDSESDFTNWQLNFNSSCSAARCVSVTGQNGFQWSPAPCVRSAAGFLCEFSSTEQCQTQAAGPEESVFYTTPYGFRVEQVPSVPSGSIATRLPSGTRSLCSSTRWLPAPWSCDISGGGCQHRCGTDPNNRPVCLCPPGRVINPNNGVSCEASGTGDPCATRRCQQICFPNGTCGCQHGLRLAEDGASCVDVDKCADERQCPGENFRCANTPLGFQCVCRVGFTLRRGLCVDKDECASWPCEHVCVNTPGSYKCSCNDGYKVDAASPNKCKPHCGREECPALCDPNNRHHCYCPDGYLAEERPEGTFCLDIDECAYSYCDQGCRNNFGSYLCSCDRGFLLVDLYKCVKTDHEGPEVVATTLTISTTPPVLNPDPTLRPSALTPGGLVGIIVVMVVLIGLLVFGVHLGLSQRVKKTSTSGSLNAEEERHSLQRVTSLSHTDKGSK